MFSQSPGRSADALFHRLTYQYRSILADKHKKTPAEPPKAAGRGGKTTERKEKKLHSYYETGRASLIHSQTCDPD